MNDILIHGFKSNQYTVVLGGKGGEGTKCLGFVKEVVGNFAYMLRSEVTDTRTAMGSSHVIAHPSWPVLSERRQKTTNSLEGVPGFSELQDRREFIRASNPCGWRRLERVVYDGRNI